LDGDEENDGATQSGHARNAADWREHEQTGYEQHGPEGAPAHGLEQCLDAYHFAILLGQLQAIEHLTQRRHLKRSKLSAAETVTYPVASGFRTRIHLGLRLAHTASGQRICAIARNSHKAFPCLPPD